MNKHLELSWRVQLPGSEVNVSRLGYGTSLLMARLNRRQSIRLVEAALDAGITHFDTARLYGYGEAEDALGEAIKGKRSQVTIATKAGIMPPLRTPALSLARHVGRNLVALYPGLRARFRRQAERMVRSSVFDIPSLTASLETSLRRLRTEYVDIFLLHECSEQDLTNPDLLMFLESVQRSGKVRSFGLSCAADVTRAALIGHTKYTRVIQFPNSIFEPNLEGLKIPPICAVLTHSALSTGFSSLWSRLNSDPDLMLICSRSLGIDCNDRSSLGALLLQYAAISNPDGAVLFSSTDERNIAAGAQAIQSPVDEAQLRELASLTANLIAPHVLAAAQ